MKILIATDGSKCANDAQQDLQRAGLPDNTEAIVFSVADVWLPPQGKVDTGLPKEWDLATRKAKARAEETFNQAKGYAQADKEKLSQVFPTWKIECEAAADSPGWGIINRAEQWNADLIVVGSQGLSGFSKLIHGSISQKVITHANVAVRIGRCSPAPDRTQIRIIVGMDGSESAIRTIDHISRRSWPADTEIRIISVIDPRLSTAAISYLPDAAHWIQEGYKDEEAWIRGIIEKETVKLTTAGLKVTSSILQGDPKFIILEFAKQWEADCIFVGARGLTGIERFLMGSVSEAIASRAQCSVEVVRK